MARYLYVILFLVMSVSLYGQDIKIIDFEHLKQEFNKKSDTVYVYNFWATWCKPCTEEMPDLLKVEKEFRNEKIKLILVSLDIPSQKDTRLANFIKDYSINSEVLLLDEPDANKWIPLVDESWTGSIPATLIHAPARGYRKFHEGMITYSELKSHIQSLIQQ
ncbi:MAG: TlpA disulfide reductase family protein [Bacteroidales bacterium]|nr:TlpA disulfide reductase family protein [Bacteroidales bacterium]